MGFGTIMRKFGTDVVVKPKIGGVSSRIKTNRVHSANKLSYRRHRDRVR